MIKNNMISDNCLDEVLKGWTFELLKTWSIAIRSKQFQKLKGLLNSIRATRLDEILKM